MRTYFAVSLVSSWTFILKNTKIKKVFFAFVHANDLDFQLHVGQETVNLNLHDYFFKKGGFIVFILPLGVLNK